jgi:ribA/ribD-fused uncharacterized protein
MPICFYSKTENYYWLSNFSPHGFEVDGQFWPSVEHYFQAQKFPGNAIQDKIRMAKTPSKAKQLGRTRSVPLRDDWEAVKDEIMRQAVLRKFETHKQLRQDLLDTGDEELIEKAPGDYYWGCGADGSGKNMLGKILMEVRARLRERDEREGDL